LKLTIRTTLAASDLELAYWFADEEISRLLCRVVRVPPSSNLTVSPLNMMLQLQLVFLKPVFYQLAQKLDRFDEDQVPYSMVTQSKRVVNEAYNGHL
jgi:hypothetical protein